MSDPERRLRILSPLNGMISTHKANKARTELQDVIRRLKTDLTRLMQADIKALRPPTISDRSVWFQNQTFPASKGRKRVGPEREAPVKS